MSRFRKGKSGNPKGRPKGSLNKDNPQTKLKQALSNGYDIKKLKALILEYISDENTKMSPKDIKDLLKLALDAEIKLLRIAFDQDEKSKPLSEHEEDLDFDDDDDDVPEVSLKAR
ncbi:MAG: hypothetical protein GOVbin4162_15 [Prokaryotic dsDNA virus sp.]|nr:MAG: hypothetical protein GOVbin4162_15 [Prokaryotic dsDNA virus sp.]|tara:strand:- start:65 stop:409 length:345 start_codon:yes stop_codon:yes gene_type:complete